MAKTTNGEAFVATDGNSSDIDIIQSTSTAAFGGADTITTGDGSDIVIGGRLDDVIDAGNGDNVVIGDSAIIVSGVVDAPQLPGLPASRATWSRPAKAATWCSATTA